MVIRLFEAMGETLKVMYNDRMDVTFAETVVRDGFTFNEFPEEPQLTDKPCKANLIVEDPIEGTTGEKSVREIQVFCNLDLTIPAGSRVTIRRLNSRGERIAEYSGETSISNDPNRYHGHQTFAVQLTSSI